MLPDAQFEPVLLAVHEPQARHQPQPHNTRRSITRASWARPCSSFEKLVSSLQQQCHTLARPPAEAVTWPKALLRRWYKDGGQLSLAAIESMGNDDFSPKLMRYIGIGQPVHLLEPTVHPSGGLLGAAARGDKTVFARLADQLRLRGFALADLGASEEFWPQIGEEGRSLWPLMKPGILQSAEGIETRGRDPSGSRRGDRFVACSVAAHKGTYPALATLDEALACVGTALNDAAMGGLLFLRSDPFFACFPGGGAAYGAHFDGGSVDHDGKASTLLTTIVYPNEGWTAADGGALHLYDDSITPACWREVRPHAGHIVLFHAPRMLHKVMPCYRQRFALTSWWIVSPRGDRSPEGTMRTVKTLYEPGDPRRTVCFARALDGSTERGVLARMRAAVGRERVFGAS